MELLLACNETEKKNNKNLKMWEKEKYMTILLFVLITELSC